MTSEKFSKSIAKTAGILATATLTVATPALADYTRPDTYSGEAGPTRDAEEATIVPFLESARVAPRAGVWTVTPERPTWCNRPFKPFRARKVTDAERMMRELERIGDAAAFSCTWPDDPNQQAWTANRLQMLVNQYGMPRARLHEYMRAQTAKAGKSRASRGRGGSDEAACPFADSSLDLPAEKDTKYVLRGLFCGDRVSFLTRPMWQADRNHELDPLLRVSLMYYAFRLNYSGIDDTLEKGELDIDSVLGNEDMLAHWAFFRRDVDKLNDEEFFSKAGEFSISDENWAKTIEIYYTLKGYLRLIENAFAQISQRVPELGPMINEVPIQAYDTWVEQYTAHRAHVDRVYTIEDALQTQRRRDMEGCSEMATGAWQSFAATQNPKTQEDVEAIAASPVGYALLAGLYMCEQFHDNEFATAAIGNVLENSALQRGPRTAAVLAMYEAVRIARNENGRFPFEGKLAFNTAQNRGGLYEVSAPYANGGGSQARAWGKVQSVSKANGMVTVTFKRETTTEPIYNCVETNKVHRIAADGTIVYRKNCTQTGTREVVVSADPIIVTEARAEGIKKNAYVTAILELAGDERNGYPTAVFKSAKQEKMVAYFGVALR